MIKQSAAGRAWQLNIFENRITGPVESLKDTSIGKCSKRDTKTFFLKKQNSSAKWSNTKN